MSKVNYISTIAHAIMKRMPDVSEDAALNEAMRILWGDGYMDAKLVRWESATTGEVWVNVMPMVAPPAREAYGELGMFLCSSCAEFTAQMAQRRCTWVMRNYSPLTGNF